MSDGTKPPSLWLPDTNQVNLAHLGKLLEELGEAVSIVSRCIIQGINENDPETGKSNILALEEELADVAAMSKLVVDRFKLDQDRMSSRATRKYENKALWNKMITVATGTE